MRPSIEIRVDRVVVDGGAVGDAHALRHAIGAELARILAEEGLPPSMEAVDAAIARVAGPAHPTPGDDATLGALVARGIVDGLGR